MFNLTTAPRWRRHLKPCPAGAFPQNRAVARTQLRIAGHTPPIHLRPGTTDEALVGMILTD